MKNIVSIFFILILQVSFSQKLEHVEPPNWWVGMSDPDLQLMIHGKQISNYQVKIDHSGVNLRAVTRVTNPNYLFIDLTIEKSAKPGTVTILFANEKEQFTHEYSLLPREKEASLKQGFSPADVIYLITPDRFVNGNPDNDQTNDTKEGLNRKEPYGRHGGDLRGIIHSLEYISDMGFTSIWLNPVMENDQANYSYHGYAITDFYKVDPRYGTNQLYKKLSSEAKNKGIGIIKDVILNHCGDEHWWMKDLPMDNWVNYQQEYNKGEFIKTTHMRTTVQDPYKAEIDLKEFSDGWFVRSMPDLNQRNPYMATYLIQNSIWWIEYADLSGIRVDTYPYPDKEFTSDWTCAIMNEYPNFNIVGEEWTTNQAILAHWQREKDNPNDYTSCLPSLMDFPLQNGLVESLKKSETGWTSGWTQLYETLAGDFQYADPFNFVVFPDNHDMSRIFTQLDENYDLFKLAITYTLTVRGIPQIYYGTEILMSHPGTDSHGIIRSDFPGGWEGDKVNAFTRKGLTTKQKEAQDFMKTLLNWRKGSLAIRNGDLLHYAPKESIYTLFRYTDDEVVMVLLSKNEKDVKVDMDRYYEILEGNENGRNVLTGENVILKDHILVPAMSAMILDLRR